MLTNLSLFSGAGGLDLSAKWTGKIRTVAYVEYDLYAQGVLMSRMRDGSLDDAPIFEDVRTFRGTSLRGSIDIVSGGFPCQDLSVAGKQAGIEAGARSGLWKEFARIICEVGPFFVLVENVPGLLVRGQLGIVLGDLAEMGFDAEWEMLSAAAVGAPHLRERVWVVAYSMSPWERRNERKSKAKTDVANSQGSSGTRLIERSREIEPRRGCWGINWQEAFSKFCGMDDGMAYRVDRIRLCGNGVVPQCAEIVWQKIIEMSGIE